MTESEGGLEKVAEILNWRDSKLFSPAERVALEYAERITYTDRQVDDALFAALKKHYTEAQIVELTAAIALENFRSKFNPDPGCRGTGLLHGADGGDQEGRLADRPGWSCQGNAQLGTQAVRDAIVQRQRTSMMLGDIQGNCQPKPETADALARGVRPIEWLQDERLLVVGNARPVVFDLDRHLIWEGCVEADRDRGAELDRIVDQVGERALEGQRQAAHRKMSRAIVDDRVTCILELAADRLDEGRQVRHFRVSAVPPSRT